MYAYDYLFPDECRHGLLLAEGVQRGYQRCGLCDAHRLCPRRFLRTVVLLLQARRSEREAVGLQAGLEAGGEHRERGFAGHGDRLGERSVGGGVQPVDSALHQIPARVGRDDGCHRGVGFVGAHAVLPFHSGEVDCERRGRSAVVLSRRWTEQAIHERTEGVLGGSVRRVLCACGVVLCLRGAVGGAVQQRPAVRVDLLEGTALHGVDVVAVSHFVYAVPRIAGDWKGVCFRVCASDAFSVEHRHCSVCDVFHEAGLLGRVPGVSLCGGVRCVDCGYRLLVHEERFDGREVAD